MAFAKPLRLTSSADIAVILAHGGVVTVRACGYVGRRRRQPVRNATRHIATPPN
jgi:hypothetical protein